MKGLVRRFRYRYLAHRTILNALVGCGLGMMQFMRLGVDILDAANLFSVYKKGDWIWSLKTFIKSKGSVICSKTEKSLNFGFYDSFPGDNKKYCAFYGSKN